MESKRARDQNEVESPEVRVTDRRRINLEGNSDQPPAEPPSLKPTYVEELEARTRAAEKSVQEVQARFEALRRQLQKETDETRQRLARTADERVEQEKADFIGMLLPVLDNLERAAEAVENSDPAIVEGIRQTISGFQSALVSAGVEAIDALSQSFDPELHEAVDTEPVDPEREGVVVGEYTRGYRMGQRLLRPARVKVGRANAGSKRAFE